MSVRKETLRAYKLSMRVMSLFSQIHIFCSLHLDYNNIGLGTLKQKCGTILSPYGNHHIWLNTPLWIIICAQIRCKKNIYIFIDLEIPLHRIHTYRKQGKCVTYLNLKCLNCSTGISTHALLLQFLHSTSALIRGLFQDFNGWHLIHSNLSRILLFIGMET